MGVTPDDVTRMLEEQKNTCGICYLPFKNPKDQCVDHNHETGKVRGILCRSCNLALGQFKDSWQVLSQAMNYLERNE